MLNQHVLSLWDSNKHKDCSVQGTKLLVFITEMKKGTSNQIVKNRID